MKLPETFYIFALLITVVVHAILLVLMAASIPALFMYEEWYIALPLSVWIVTLTYLPVRCPLTTLENRIRKQLGMPLIKSFIQAYILARN